MTDASPLERVLARRIVPVVVIEDAADAVPLGRALEAGGLPVAEITLRTPAAMQAIRSLAETDLLVGAGTVVRPEQVDEVAAAGARFVVSPGLSPTVVERCRSLGVPVLPGVATATELTTALDLGIGVVKLFPAEPIGGEAMLRALAAPFPEVRFVPTGGVTEANAAAYLSHPRVAAVGGSWMVAPDLVARRDFDEVTRRTAAAVALAGVAA